MVEDEHQVVRLPVQDDLPANLQQNLWSKLPIELVINIISQTTSQSTQDVWCQATENSHYLHEIAMRIRWHSVTIDDRDLLPAPGDDRIRFNRVQKLLRKHGITKHWKQAGHMLEMLLETNESGRCPANYVKNVIFDFRMTRYWTDETITIEEENAHELMPSLKSAEHTLELLKEYLYNLKQITCYGDAPQQLLDFICRYATGAEALKLRVHASYGALHIYSRDAPDRNIHPNARLPLELKCLSMLQQLVHLDVHRFSCFEVEALRTTLPKLANLEVLVLACNKAEHATVNGCAFDTLFAEPVEGHSEPVEWLPRGLKSLSLIDMYHYTSEDIRQARKPRLGFPLGIKHLNIDLVRPSLSTFVLNSINSTNLESLSLPQYHAHSDRSGIQPLLHDYVRQFGNRLGKIRILRAWELESIGMADLQSLEDIYTVEELILGTRNNSYYSGFVKQWSERIPIPTLSDYTYGFHWSGSEHMTGRWGTSLRRLRIDHIDITEDLDISILSQDWWQNLKILMLQPASRQRERNGDQAEKLVDQSICDKLARRVLTIGPQSLRVLVISSQWYWISREIHPSICGPSLWSWKAAQRDISQSTMMAYLLIKPDMEFLNNKDVPYWEERDTIEWHRNLASRARTMPYQPSPESLHQWNYLTLWPRQAT